ncbi:MAG TPA: hypothetical protein VD886_15945 [Herpetosiphonaceae bacterium]|nr:hypothetical protein [Herpetosiphonaceae bacterium]
MPVENGEVRVMFGLMTKKKIYFEPEIGRDLAAFWQFKVSKMDAMPMKKALARHGEYRLGTISLTYGEHRFPTTELIADMAELDVSLVGLLNGAVASNDYMILTPLGGRVVRLEQRVPPLDEPARFTMPLLPFIEAWYLMNWRFRRLLAAAADQPWQPQTPADPVYPHVDAEKVRRVLEDPLDQILGLE